MPRIIFLIMILISCNGYSEINKCIVNGKTVYTEAACPENTAKPLALKEITTTLSTPTSTTAINNFRATFGYLSINPQTHEPKLTNETTTISKGTSSNWGLMVLADSMKTKFTIQVEHNGNCEWNSEPNKTYGPYKTQGMYYLPFNSEYAEKACSGSIKIYINNQYFTTVNYEIK